MSFEDSTTTTQAIPNVDEQALAEVVTRVQAINAGTATNADALKQTFVSTAGASFTAITGALAIRTTEEEIYSG